MKLFSYKLVLLLCCFLLTASSTYSSISAKKEMYQLTFYHYTNTAQETVLNNYIKNALLPALHRYGYKNIGVFRSLANDTAAVKTMVVYVPIKNVAHHLAIANKLTRDSNYQKAGAALY